MALPDPMTAPTTSPTIDSTRPVVRDLDGQVAVVTGAGSPSGIGFGIATHLAERGAVVVIGSTTERIHERVGERQDDERAIALVQALLPTLPPRERQALELCDVEGIDRDEAADRMGVSRGALRVLLHRGRHKLRDALVSAGLGSETP